MRMTLVAIDDEWNYLSTLESKNPTFKGGVYYAWQFYLVGIAWIVGIFYLLGNLLSGEFLFLFWGITKGLVVGIVYQIVNKKI